MLSIHKRPFQAPVRVPALLWVQLAKELLTAHLSDHDFDSPISRFGEIVAGLNEQILLAMRGGLNMTIGDAVLNKKILDSFGSPLGQVEVVDFFTESVSVPNDADMARSPVANCSHYGGNLIQGIRFQLYGVQLKVQKKVNRRQGPDGKRF